MNHTNVARLVRHSQTHFLRLKLNPSSLAGVRSKRACSYLSDFPINSLYIKLCYSLPHYSHSSFATPPHLLAPSCLIFHPSELKIVPNMTQVSVALPGVVVSVIGAAESGSVVVVTVNLISSVLPPLWPRCVGTHCTCCCYGNTMYACK